MLAAAVGLFATIYFGREFSGNLVDGVGFLYVLPVALVAVELGWRWGLAASALAFGLVVLWFALRGENLSVTGYVTRAVVVFSLGGALGWLAARSRAAGEQSERWFTMANDLLAITSTDGRLTRVNPAWERALGWTREELMSRPYVEFLHPDDVAPTATAVAPLADGSAEAVGFETRFAAKEGGWRWLLWSCGSGGGQVYAVVKDVTERKRLDTEREVLLERVEAMARTDILTGLPNRRAWDEELRREMARAGRRGHSLAVLMVDLDRFKAFNDAHGHQAGDRLLAELGRAWRTQLRVTDFVARYGGEEFTALLPACPPEEMATVVDRLRSAIPGNQTCSVGIAYWDADESPESLTGRADTALYEAKRAGRDRIMTAR